MVEPAVVRIVTGLLGLDDLRLALRILTTPQSGPEGFGLGFSRRQVARSLGVNESTLRGIERVGSQPRQATIDNLLGTMRRNDLFVTRTVNERTRSDTLASPDVPISLYDPQAPAGARAFRIVVKSAPDVAYPYSTLVARASRSFDSSTEIERLRAEGFTVARILWDTGGGFRASR